ncbi:MAG TPA: response regulator receiver protein [Gammaproteobacteria bacterium]|nr:response regulator receiver protein [Gammaproteobacteria bacterium]
MTRVILVMKRPGNIRVLENALASVGAACITVSDEAALEAALGGELMPAVALVDATDFGTSVGPICGNLRGRGLPFIVLSTPNVTVRARQSFIGAAHHLEKPVGKRLLQELVSGLMQPATRLQKQGA